MASTRALLFVVPVAVAAAVLGTANSASYTAGAPAGSWDLKTNYTVWASSITFRARDQLVFKYSRAAHNVLEVSKVGYDSCSGSSPLATFQTGDDTVQLPVGGVTRYFICGVSGHCTAGMKLEVRVRPADSCHNRRRQRYPTGRRGSLCIGDSFTYDGAASGSSGNAVSVIMVLLTLGLMF